MTEQPGQCPVRVRVTGPPRRRTPPAGRRTVDAATPVGAVYLASLLREQRRLAVRLLLTLVATLGMVPLVFHLVPALSEVHVLGVPLAWALLVVGVHPLLLLLGWLYVRTAEANEEDFVLLLEEVVPDDEGGR